MSQSLPLRNLFFSSGVLYFITSSDKSVKVTINSGVDMYELTKSLDFECAAPSLRSPAGYSCRKLRRIISLASILNGF